jgi:hypothetical protein
MMIALAFQAPATPENAWESLEDPKFTRFQQLKVQATPPTAPVCSSKTHAIATGNNFTGLVWPRRRNVASS